MSAAYFVTAAQTIVSRRLNPLEMGVITIGSFDGKGTFNVIKDAVELEGDIRYMTLETKEKIEEEVRCFVSGVKADDPDIRKVVEYPMMSPSDDFAYYLEKIPGCYFYVGCTPKGVENPYFNHNPRFDIDEDALIVAAKSVGYVVCGYFGLE